jgi:hypothetical protein
VYLIRGHADFIRKKKREKIKREKGSRVGQQGWAVT